MKKILLIFLAVASLCACWNQNNRHNLAENQNPSCIQPEEKVAVSVEQEQEDTLYLWQQDSLLRVQLESADHSSLDSLLTSMVGERVTCVSYLRSCFRIGGRKWYINPSFGMALQLPDGFMPCEEANLDMVSHGTMITSQSSPIVIYVSAWYDVIDPEIREDAFKKQQEDYPDDYFREVIDQGVAYELRAVNAKKAPNEFKAMLPYLERFPKGPHGPLPVEY